MKAGISLIIISILAFLIISCNTNEPVPPLEKPPGYQDDIPWPSLADSPWPMNHHDPQSTGRSKYQGAVNGNIVKILDSLHLEASVALTSDTSLILMNLFRNYGLYSIEKDGEISWKVDNNLDILGRHSSPLIDKNGVIYLAGGYSGKLIAIEKSGAIKWKFRADNYLNLLGINIGLDGTIFCLDVEGNLYAVDSNGNLKWKYNNADFFGDGFVVLSLSPDGQTLYIPGITKTVYAFDITSQNIKWAFGEEKTFAAPMVDSDGNIYILTKHSQYNNQPSLFSLNENGKLNWVYTHNNNQQNEEWRYAEGAIDKLGNIYFAFDTLYSVNHSGKLNWKFDLKGRTMTPLVCDINGNIFVSISNKTDDTLKEISCISREGNRVWNVPITDWQLGGYSPAIGNDGYLYVPTFKSTSLLIIN